MSALDLEQEMTDNWKNYRTWLNDKIAVVSVNMDLMDALPTDRYPNIAQIHRSYQPDENGLPSEECYDDVFRHLLRNMSHLCALPNVLYAGHILCDGKAQQFFYLGNQRDFLETLSGLPHEEVSIQQDENWDIFFEFLLPTPLENKFNLTEDLLDSLSENGVDLALPQTVEHRFYFDEKENIEHFVEKCQFSSLKYNQIKYTDTPIKTPEGDFHLVKVEQEIELASQTIFHQIEQFEQLAEQFSAQYVGWEYAGFAQDRKMLN